MRPSSPAAELAAPAVAPPRRRVLAVVSNFKWGHIDYLNALARRFDLRVAWSGEAHAGALAQATREGLSLVAVGRVADVGVAEVRSRLREELAAWNPSVVHVMYYYHEALTVLARELVGDAAVVVHECRDPLTTLRSAAPGSELWRLEAEALGASHGQVFVSRVLRGYLERAHGLDLGTSLIVPHAVAARTLGPPAEKLSRRDGRVHLALVGTAAPLPDHSRYYVDIIRRLVSLGFVVHTHFHDLEGVSTAPYRALADELADYHDHPSVSFRQGTLLSDLISRYDLMGVFHELTAGRVNEAATLAVCMPTKAVCGWAHGAIPVVCFPHYGGIVEVIRELGVGFVVDDWEDLRRLGADRPAIAEATAACGRARHRFTHEWQADRLATFFDTLSTPVPSA